MVIKQAAVAECWLFIVYSRVSSGTSGMFVVKLQDWGYTYAIVQEGTNEEE